MQYTRRVYKCCSHQNLEWHLRVPISCVPRATAFRYMFQELRLNDSAIKGEDLWVPVMKAGGYEAVTSGKLWAAMGRHLGAPK